MASTWHTTLHRAPSKTLLNTWSLSYKHVVDTRPNTAKARCATNCLAVETSCQTTTLVQAINSVPLPSYSKTVFTRWFATRREDVLALRKQRVQSSARWVV